ncbi:glycerol-3-phosphate dehydrogenase [NAD(+)] 2, chloroplastic isoform X3 [Spinacia oleracea]|uniref:Glycerol-3-phosphate dehydrogenase [NAD(+)] n=1 Tax=Spinacia oleracea TaxID=3562 RepID=A0A9R0J5F5_SPIOL|nr:glycerol-3-phosphate dehydrogenase [NAD(+)] 2, chloroplastic isoform X3 [Spinacia oleracea]
MSAISELKFLTPIFNNPNSQTQQTQYCYYYHHHHPQTLKFQNENLRSKTQNFRCSNLALKPQQLRPCLAAEVVDFPPSSSNDDSEQNPEKIISSSAAAAAAVAAEERKDRRRVVRIAWEKLVRWSRSLRSKSRPDVLQRTQKVVVLGGGSFGTAMAAHVAGRKAEMEVNMLPWLFLREICCIQPFHIFMAVNIFQIISYQKILLPQLTPSLLCKFTASFLESIVDYVDPGLPFISLSKGLELNTLRMMSQIIPQALKNPRQPFVALSGPSFASELMNKLPTAMVVASRDKKLVNQVQQLLASERLRINTSSDVTGVEIAGALKNVLAIAAGIVVGMELGNNSMAALVAQGCSEIRWLAKKMGANSATLTGLSGTGDIMLTCFVNLSRNRTVGVRLGSGEKLEDILSSMNQVAEGVTTAGAVISLAQKYNVKMPVLTAVARIIDNELTPQAAVLELMSLPQVEEV